MDEKETTLPHATYRTYVSVWLVLVALTAVTVTVTRLHLTRYAVPAAVLIASMKAGLILNFFMHLKYEARVLKAMLLMALLTFTLVIALTFTDVWYR